MQVFKDSRHPPLFKPTDKGREAPSSQLNLGSEQMEGERGNLSPDAEANLRALKAAYDRMLSAATLHSKMMGGAKSVSGRASSLKKLHHSNSSSAFQTIDTKEPEKSSNAQMSLHSSTDSSQTQMALPIQKALSNHYKSQASSETSDPPEDKKEQQRKKMLEACAANRKAAIIRFKAKRNQRNFEKKVRYASRQKLAHRRPRVKGQFVKGVYNETKETSTRGSPTSFLADAVEDQAT